MDETLDQTLPLQQPVLPEMALPPAQPVGPVAPPPVTDLQRQIMSMDAAQLLQSKGKIKPETYLKMFPAIDQAIASGEKPQAIVKNVNATVDPNALPYSTMPTAVPENVSLTTDNPQFRVDPQEQQKMLLDQLRPSYDGIDMQQAAILEGARVGAAKGAETAAAIENVAKDNEKRLVAEESAAKQRQEIADKGKADLDAAVSQFSKMEVDPNRYWANKSTGDKVLAGIGLFLGAFGQGGNKAVPVIENAINQDLATQKANIAKQGDVVAAKKGIYNDMLSKFKDERLAEQATRVAYLDNAILKTKAIAERYQGPELKAKANALIGGLEQSKLNAQNAFGMQMLSKLPSFLNPGDPSALNEDQRKRYVPGMGIALTEDDAKTLKAAAGDNIGAKENIRELLKISEMPGKKINFELAGRASTIATMLKGQLRLALIGPGAVTDREQELLDKIVADPTKIASLDSTNRAVLNELIARLDNSLASKAKAYGLTTENQRIGFKPMASK